jgi:hypothetical protein
MKNVKPAAETLTDLKLQDRLNAAMAKAGVVGDVLLTKV